MIMIHGTNEPNHELAWLMISWTLICNRIGPLCLIVTVPKVYAHFESI